MEESRKSWSFLSKSHGGSIQTYRSGRPSLKENPSFIELVANVTYGRRKRNGVASLAKVARSNCDNSRPLTVELSGAHADDGAWHFILHASAPAIC